MAQKRKRGEGMGAPHRAAVTYTPDPRTSLQLVAPLQRSFLCGQQDYAEMTAYPSVKVTLPYTYELRYDYPLEEGECYIHVVMSIWRENLMLALNRPPLITSAMTNLGYTLATAFRKELDSFALPGLLGSIDRQHPAGGAARLRGDLYRNAWSLFNQLEDQMMRHVQAALLTGGARVEARLAAASNFRRGSSAQRNYTPPRAKKSST